MALLRSVATVGSYTLLSRVFGFIRDILTAALLGAGPVADAFFVAQRLPNLFRSLFAEGAFSAAFVPLFAGTMAEHGREAARIFAEDALAVLLAALLAFVLLGEIFMPAVMARDRPGVRRGSGQVRSRRRSRPDHLPLSSLYRAGGAAGRRAELGRSFRRRRRDADPAEPVPDRRALDDGPVRLARRPRPRLGGHRRQGSRSFCGCCSRARRAGLALRLPLPRLTPGVRRTLAVMAPGTVGAGVTQLNLLISTALASLLPGGSVSYLYYADRLNQLPLGVVGIAVGTAILPSLSRQIRLGHLADAVDHPEPRARAGVAADLAGRGGACRAGDADPRGAVPARRLQRRPTPRRPPPLLRPTPRGCRPLSSSGSWRPRSFARHDTATPVKVAVAAMATNLCLTLVLMQFLAHVGIALATTVAGWVNALTLLGLLGPPRAFPVRRARAAQPAAGRRRGSRHGRRAGACCGVALVRHWRGRRCCASARSPGSDCCRARRLRASCARLRRRGLAQSLWAAAPATGLTGSRGGD